MTKNIWPGRPSQENLNVRWIAFLLTSAALFAGIAPPALSQVWQPISPMPTVRERGVLAAIGGKLHATNGSTRASMANTLEVYDPSTGAWSSLQPSPNARTTDGAVIGSVLYLVGGAINADLHALTGLVETYNTATGIWGTAASMPTPRWGVGIGTINGRIYVAAGGTDCLPCVPQPNVLEIFDPANGWTSGTPIPTTREHPASAVVNGKLYVIGGFTRPANAATNVVEAYDPSTNSWSSLAPMPTARWAAAAAVVDGRIHVMGGSTAAGATALHEIYDPATNTWSASVPLLQARYFLSAAAIGSQIYVAGGVLASEQVTNSVEVFTDVLNVAIDIKPNSSDNSIALGSGGVVPVAILSSASFDASQVDPESVTLSGAPVRLIGRGNKYSCSRQDVNSDGRMDLLCHVETAQFMLQTGDTTAVLLGSTFGGQRIRGEDSIRIVP